jgi:hypothetical protein
MKPVILCLLLICSSPIFAQRLYLHDMFNGNYKSYDVGSKIELTLLDSTKKIEGRITTIDNNYFYVNDSIKVAIKQVASVIVGRNSGKAKRVLRIIGGSIMVIYGVPLTISGAAIIAVEEPVIGMAVLLIGSALTTGGIMIIVKQGKTMNHVTQRIIDGENYRLFIE